MPVFILVFVLSMTLMCGLYLMLIDWFLAGAALVSFAVAVVAVLESEDV